MVTKPTLPVVVAALLTAIVPLAAGCGGAAIAAQPAQHVAVTARDTELVVKGAASLHAGFVRFEIRNEGRGEHGIQLVRLRRPVTTARLLQAFAAEMPGLLEALGGNQQVMPGRPFQMTERLGAGSYALLDIAQNGPKPNYARGLYKRFEVEPSHSGAGVPPATVGGIDMHDFHFALGLPNGFSGHGAVKITNLGQASHEISLVRIEPGHTQREVLSLILAGARRPPEWASIVELLSVLDPANSVYVKFDLTPGRYVALCLMNEPGSPALHAQLGMIGTFDVK